jgi:hypothetical protein
MMEGDAAYEAMLEQDRDAAREIFEEFIDEWEDIYRRERQFLSQLVHPSSHREILVTRDTTYDAFVKALLEEANNAPQTYAEAKRITKSEEPLSSARLYFNELMNKAKEKTTLPYRRRSFSSRRTSQEDSSEDEGEIIEEGEIEAEKSEEPSKAGHEIKSESVTGETNTSSEDKTPLSGHPSQNLATEGSSKVQLATAAQGAAIGSKELQAATTESNEAPECCDIQMTTVNGNAVKVKKRESETMSSEQASEEMKPLQAPHTSNENSTATDVELPATTA